MTKRWPLPVLLIVAGLLFFTPLMLAPLSLLYSDTSDFLTYHLPCKTFLVRGWQTDGELPLWCPQMFAGMPFVHDPQVAAFYPLHLPLYVTPVEHLGAVCAWLIVLHVIVAGLCMYAYARHRGLERTGALIAGLGYMFAGKWLMHLLTAGHFNLAPLAFVPLVLLLVERATARTRWRAALGAGLVFAGIVLGTHPQLTAYAGLFVALWTLGMMLADLPVARPDEPIAWQHVRPAVTRWVGFGVLTGVTAALLAAVQILPALEATAHSSRTLGVSADPEVGTRALRTFLGLVGPPLTADPTWLWEDRGGLGLIWLALALCAPILDSRRWVRTACWLTLVWLLLGLGGAALLRWIPGLHLWRLPSRMLLLAGLPVALLAGTTVDALLAHPAQALRQRCLIILIALVLFILAPVGAYAKKLDDAGATLRLSPYWLSLLATIPVAGWLLAKGGMRSDKSPEVSSLFRSTVLWVVISVIDVWALALPLVAVKPAAEVYATSASIQYLQATADRHERILDINPLQPDNALPASATPLWPNLAMMAGLEPVRGYNPLDILRYKQFLMYVMNDPTPLRALDNFTLPGPGGFPIVNAALANLLGVRFLLLPADVPLANFVADPEARHRSWKLVFEDAAPRTYSGFPTPPAGQDGGLRGLPPYRVYENYDVLPRAFVVFQAQRLPAPLRLLDELDRMDFRRTVWLERDVPPAGGMPDEPVGRAEIRAYTANRITVAVQADRQGWLVLTDPWFPGWTATVDGVGGLVQRADYCFRAVEIPAGSHEVVLQFEPRWYGDGKFISLTTLGVLLVIGLGFGVRYFRSQRASQS